MQPSLIGPSPTHHHHYCYPNPNNQFFPAHHNSQFTNPTAIKTRTSTSSNTIIRKNRRRTILSSSHTKTQTHYKNPSLQTEDNTKNTLFYFTKDLFLLEEINNSNNNNKDRRNQTLEEEEKENQEGKIKNQKVGLIKMWWTNLKSALGQRLNFEGITSFVAVAVKDSHLALPHLTVQDIRWIDWAEMKRRGFRGVVFDKDNTLTVPYSLSLWPPLSSSLDQCRSVFGDNIVVFSNSAGLRQFDADGTKARALEESVGVHVLRHSVKKPAGKAEEVEKYFCCGTSHLVMVGDRHFTDIVYGNRNGFLTILTKPLSLAEEPFIVKQVRKLEAYLVNQWHKRGLKPTSHSLVEEAMQCVKHPSPL